MRKLLFRAVVLVTLLLGIQMGASAQWTWTPQTGRWVNIKRMPKETAELQIEYARSLMMQGHNDRALKETEKFQNFYGKSELADQNQFLRGEIKLAQGENSEAAKEFQKVVTSYPASPLYEKVIAKQYEIGDKLYEQGNKRMAKRWAFARKRPFKRAIEVYTMVINNQPFTEAAAEAQYKVGLCHHTRKEYVQAAFEYKRVIEDYSASDWVDDACFGLAKCYYDSARPADYDQAPSQLAIDAIDDFTHRFPEDARVKDLGDKRTKMRETIALQRLQTAQYYEKRRDYKGARVYYQLVVDSFSDTPSAEMARKWLSDNPVKEVRAQDRILKGTSKSS